MTDHSTATLDEDNSYPSVEVHIDVDGLKLRVLEHVFDSLLQIDINKAVNAIMRGKGSETNESDEPEITVTTLDEEEGGPMLQFSLNSFAVFDVNVDPAKFDHTNKSQTRIFERCQRLVKALRDSQYGVTTSDHDYKHPRLGSFKFWVSKEGQDAALSAEEWAAVGAAWGLA